jgi:hypothetical protein
MASEAAISGMRIIGTVIDQGCDCTLGIALTADMKHILPVVREFLQGRGHGFSSMSSIVATLAIFWSD